MIFLISDPVVALPRQHVEQFLAIRVSMTGVLHSRMDNYVSQCLFGVFVHLTVPDPSDLAPRKFLLNPLIFTDRWSCSFHFVSFPYPRIVILKVSFYVDQIAEKRILPKIITGRQQIVRGILKQADPKLKEFGIQLIDVQIKRLNYVEEVRRSVYGRMIAERKQIAEKFRSEGTGEARKIEGNRDKELKRITSEAYREAQEIKGKADAEATLIYAQGYSRDPDFYSFLKSLEVYKETMDKNSSLVLSTDSDFLRYFKSLKKDMTEMQE